MKTVVSVQEITELDIKPKLEIAQWRGLVEAEIASRWRERASWIRVTCPCCAGQDRQPAFAHAGVAYVECNECGTVYAPERPPEVELVAWYRDSAPARFWREQMLAVSGQARLEQIVRPRAQWILDGVAEYAPSARSLVDLSAHGRALLDELAAGSASLVSIVAAGPTSDLERGVAERVQARPTRIGNLVELAPADVVTAIDTLDRAADLPALLSAIHGVLRAGGLLFATLPAASGFELQALWDRSPSILPPDRLNLPTIEGVHRLFASGWDLLELSTTGIFDVEIVRHAIASAPEAGWPRVLRALVERTTPAARQAFTEYLQSQRLTSFARLVARRKA